MNNPSNLLAVPGRSPLAILLIALLLAPGSALADGPGSSTDSSSTQLTSSAASQPSDSARFLRFVDDGRGGGRLLTAIRTYRNHDGVTVHLVAAVHVGEHAYYTQLAKTFGNYDALLYEMIMPKGMKPPAPGNKSESGVSSVQRWMKNTLQLDFQLDAIDYRKPNFIHADLDAETFFKLEDERGESLVGLMLQEMLKEMASENAEKGNPPPTVVDWLAAMASPDRARQFKLLLGKQFGQIEDAFSGLGGPNGTVLVTERNKAAISALKQTIADGRKNIGIFYGAAHMTDMERRLIDMGFQEAGPAEWRVAWDMVDKNPTTGPVISPVDRLLHHLPTTQPGK